MAGRRLLCAIVVAAAGLHAVSISQSLLPAQDGLKFIRIARQFHHQPWADVVRQADQHPLYPALVALVHPLVAGWLGPGPDSWRVAAQGVAAAASLALLFPLFGLSRALFHTPIAQLAVLIFVLLPVPAEVGRDTLADSLGLLGVALSLGWGCRALRDDSWPAALAAGLAGGLGYLARPEAILAPVAVGLAWMIRHVHAGRLRAAVAAPALPALAFTTLALVGGYALIKGEVSEKLALRQAAGLGAPAVQRRPAPQWLPPGLDDPRWDFSPKEETERKRIGGVTNALTRIASQWWEELCWGFAVMAVWGMARSRFIRRMCDLEEPQRARGPERLVLATFVILFGSALTRHAAIAGYLSGRHTLPLVLVSTPWAAAGCYVCMRRLGELLPWSRQTARAVGLLGIGLVASILAAYQLRPPHPSRWGHWAAGRWLAEHRGPAETVLDTRGWARFVSESPGYDFWHVRQAFTDSRLSYVVVGHDELQADSPRARTLNAVLAHAASPLRDFPAFHDGMSVGVRIYRFHRPDHWQGIAP